MMFRLLFLPCLLVQTGLALAASCPAAPPGERDIRANSFYSDSAGSVIDTERLAQYKADAAPIDDYLKRVVKFASDYQAGNADAGSCGMAWLERWADDKALLGQGIGGSQAEFERKWTLAGLSVAYLKLRPAATGEQRAKIARWFPAIADHGLAYFDNPGHKRNNHYYWVGLATLGAGLAANDRRYIDAGRRIFEAALADIQDDGTLPLEMARAGRALHYHNYALQPLVMMAEEARLLGEDWYALRNRRLDLLATRVLAGLRDPEWFAARAGAKQEIPHGQALGWLLLYRRVAPDAAALDPWLPRERISDSRLGGSLNELAAKGFPAPSP